MEVKRLFGVAGNAPMKVILDALSHPRPCPDPTSEPAASRTQAPPSPRLPESGTETREAVEDVDFLLPEAPMLLPTPLLLLAQLACDPHCVGEDCEKVPEIPWDPGEDTGGDAPYGYGDTEETEETEDTDSPPVDTALPPVEVVSVRDCNVGLRHARGGASSLEVTGEFNDWGRTALAGTDEDGFATADLGELAPGEYAYQLITDGVTESEPPANVYTKWFYGTEFRNLRVGDCHAPLLQTLSASATSAGRVEATFQFASAADESPLERVTVTVGDTEVSPEIDPSTGEIRVSVSGLPSGKQSVKVWAWDEAGREAENSPAWVPLWVEATPFSWEDALLYFAFTDRFRNGDWGEDTPYSPISDLASCSNWNGGDFLGVIHAMDEGYFEDLGVNTLWLSPVYENPEGSYLGIDGIHWYSGYHGYWATSPTAIEARYGDQGEGFWVTGEDRLQELIADAHSRGIRVLFDLTLNQIHQDHAYVTEHPEWFGSGCVCGTAGCDWDERALDCWFTDYLPDLNYTNHEVLMRVVDDTLDLIRDWDVDAVRIDAAKHMHHVIMRTLRMRLQDDFESGGGAPFWVVGETFTSDRDYIMDFVADWELSGQFDFPLYYGIRDAFISGGSFATLDSAAASSDATYGDAVMAPFLGNHDVERFTTAIDGRGGDCWSGWTEEPMTEGDTSTVTQWDLIHRLSMAFAFTLTQPGVPLIYYGDEIGMHGWNDPDNRRPMNFEPYLSANQRELLGRIQAIGQARAASEALRRGERRQLWVDEDFYVYARDNGGGDVALVAMNKGSGTETQSVNVSSLGMEGATLTDALGSGRTLTVSGGSASITLDSWQSAIFLR